MAAISVAKYKSMPKALVTGLTDDQIGARLAMASALAYSINRRVLGHYIESWTTVGSDAQIKAYGHGLQASGKVYIANTGTTLDKNQYSFVRVSEDLIKLTGVTIPSGLTTGGNLCMPMTGDFEVRDYSITVLPSPIAAVAEIRVDTPIFMGGDVTPFGDDTIIQPTEYYVPATSDFLGPREIQVSVTHGRFRGYRVPGLINPMTRQVRRIMRTSYYAGCVGPIPNDIVFALADLVKTSAIGAVQFTSESYDYYSYQMMSPDQLSSHPASAVAILMRYQ